MKIESACFPVLALLVGPDGSAVSYEVFRGAPALDEWRACLKSAAAAGLRVVELPLALVLIVPGLLACVRVLAERAGPRGMDGAALLEASHNARALVSVADSSGPVLSADWSGGHSPLPWRAVPSLAGGGSARVDLVSDGAEFSPSFVAADLLPRDAEFILNAVASFAAPIVPFMAAARDALQECAAEISRLNSAAGETVFNPAAASLVAAALALLAPGAVVEAPPVAGA